MPKFPVLEGETETDVVVIGGGMAGVLTAYLLGLRGIACVVLEAGRVGGGVTGGTTAKITAQHGLCYDTMLRQLGRERAGEYARINSEALARFAQIVTERGIACDFRRVSAHLYATKPHEGLERECQAACELGLPADMVEQTELPFGIWGALRFRDQAVFHPLKFLAHIAGQCRIYEKSRALRVEEGLVTTETGSARGKHVVVATHFPFLNRPGYYFMRMHQEASYIVALEGVKAMQDAYLGVDGDKLSVRSWGEFLLLCGGGHRVGENVSGGKYAGLIRAAARHWPGSRVVSRWSAQDCVSHDQIPYIGKYGGRVGELYVATGFRKWGMSGSMAAAMLLSRAIAGEERLCDTVFSPQRDDRLAPSFKGIVKDSGVAVKGLAKQVFSAPAEKLRGVSPGTGEIVTHDGEKLGVYRDEDGKLHGVKTACTHLGCQLSFNADDKTWDCACHGSRFSCDGDLLNGPGQLGLDSLEGLNDEVASCEKRSKTLL